MNKRELEVLTQAIIVKTTDKETASTSHTLHCRSETQLRNRSWGPYFNNCGACRTPDRAVTTAEQRRGLTQYPPQPGADTRGKRSCDPEACRKETTSTVS